MFAGIDIASERHMLARLDATGAPIGKPDRHHRGSRRLRYAARGARAPPVLIVMEATGHYWKNLFAVLTAAGHEVALAQPARRPALPGGQPRAHQDRRDRRRRPRPPRLREAARAHPAARRGRREPARARPPPRPAAPGFRRPGPPAAPPGRPRLPRVHPLRPQPRQHARHLPARRISHRAGLRPRQSAAPRQAALRRPPLRRRRAGRPARGGGQALGRPAPRPGLRAAGPPHLPGSRSLAPPPGRDRARHRGPARHPRGRQAAAQHRRHRPAVGRPHHRRRRRPGPLQERRRLRRLCRRRPGPQAVRQAVGPPRAPIARSATPPAHGPVDAGARRRPPQPLAARLLRRLRAAGKPPKLALIAAMRKLLHAVYSVIRPRRR